MIPIDIPANRYILSPRFKCLMRARLDLGLHLLQLKRIPGGVVIQVNRSERRAVADTSAPPDQQSVQRIRSAFRDPLCGSLNLQLPVLPYIFGQRKFELSSHHGGRIPPT